MVATSPTRRWDDQASSRVEGGVRPPKAGDGRKSSRCSPQGHGQGRALSGSRTPAGSVEDGEGGHFGHFIRRRPQTHDLDLKRRHPRGPLLGRPCHPGNISYRLGEPPPYSGATRAFGDNKDAGETSRHGRDLRSNDPEADRTDQRVGPKLWFDAKKSRSWAMRAKPGS